MGKTMDAVTKKKLQEACENVLKSDSAIVIGFEHKKNGQVGCSQAIIGKATDVKEMLYEVSKSIADGFGIDFAELMVQLTMRHAFDKVKADEAESMMP